MNLKEYVEQYVRYHRSLGKQFETQARHLRGFVRKFESSKTIAALTPLEIENYIRESILDPSAYIVEGYQDNIMPKNYDELIEEDQLDDLVAFLLAQQ